MEVGVILVVVGLVLLSGSALAAFFWAAHDGQLENLDHAPEVIFEEAEPMGRLGDCFPNTKRHEDLTQAGVKR